MEDAGDHPATAVATAKHCSSESGECFGRFEHAVERSLATGPGERRQVETSGRGLGCFVALRRRPDRSRDRWEGWLDVGDYDRRYAERVRHWAIQTLERQGYRVTLEPAA